ncbi:hypothetical protein L914_16722 [Phytophthora nicotianae]|uniref:Uncharacterized protein n=2 Tax=Phytophthora nicotianae TaxID=4792 RepID=V9EEP7_PHYNI|nr:hypothetical protein F443_17384 [Phytophthora nicotianae P1569]ETM36632.1 hypothetical protein L914_16722 [Phytophthora nicotianae]
MGIATLPFVQTLAAVVAAQQGGDDTGVTFTETIEHLGGLPVLAAAVLLLALVYIALVEWLLPRGRRQHQLKESQRQKINFGEVQAARRKSSGGDIAGRQQGANGACCTSIHDVLKASDAEATGVEVDRWF